MSKPVFLSHASRDAEDVREARAALQSAGVGCWMAPDDIPGSADYAEAIVVAIKGSSLFVLFLSERATRSDNVRNEIEIAHRQGKSILCVRMDDAPVPERFEYFVNSRQWVDVGAGLGRWDDLVRQAVRLTGGSPPPTRPRPPTPTRWRALATGAGAFLSVLLLAAFLWHDEQEIPAPEPPSQTVAAQTQEPSPTPMPEPTPPPTTDPTPPPTTDATENVPSAPTRGLVNGEKSANRSSDPDRPQIRTLDHGPTEECTAKRLRNAACQLFANNPASGTLVKTVTYSQAGNSVTFKSGTGQTISKSMNCKVTAPQSMNLDCTR